MIKPILKWAGGKSRLLPELLPLLPAGDRLIEPFVGSGAVFLNTDYPSYVLNDLNFDLINLYNVLYSEPAGFSIAVRYFFSQRDNPEAFYYQIRNDFNTPGFYRWAPMRAAAFLYLNKHCFNGLCRYNRTGAFNVPYGKYKFVNLPAAEIAYFNEKIHSCRVVTSCCDFELPMLNAGPGDVIYCDPPYVPINADSFTDYTAQAFSIDDHIRLHRTAVAAVANGASVVISNSDNPITRDLYRGFVIHEITARRSISANGTRTPASEIIAVLTPGDL